MRQICGMWFILWQIRMAGRCTRFLLVYGSACFAEGDRAAGISAAGSSHTGVFRDSAGAQAAASPEPDRGEAQQLSEMAFDETKYHNLEDAISNFRVDAMENGIHMHDKDLQGIETALNGLLERIRASYKQQTQFVSDASHELRTPIAVIQGYVNMLDRWGKEDTAILGESIEAIKNEANHMQKLVEQLLFLARGIRTGRCLICGCRS